MSRKPAHVPTRANAHSCARAPSAQAREAEGGRQPCKNLPAPHYAREKASRCSARVSPSVSSACSRRRGRAFVDAREVAPGPPSRPACLLDSDERRVVDRRHAHDAGRAAREKKAARARARARAQATVQARARARVTAAAARRQACGEISSPQRTLSWPRMWNESEVQWSGPLSASCEKAFGKLEKRRAFTKRCVAFPRTSAFSWPRRLSRLSNTYLLASSPSQPAPLGTSRPTRRRPRCARTRARRRGRS
jgi:hypothetical protein